MRVKDLIFSILLAIVSLMLVAELFVTPGRELTGDVVIHLTTMAQFSKALADHDFPVMWTDGFANYGFPLSIFAHQFTSYAGGILISLTHQVVLSSNLLYAIGAVSSTLFMYLFLRLYFRAEAAFVGAFALNVAPYRILNIYARGALPEFFSSVFVPLILIGIFLTFVKKKWYGLVLMIAATALLPLTHPMMLVVNLPLILAYALFVLMTDKKNVLRNGLLFVVSMAIAALMTSYYLLPLYGEIKFFYQGVGEQNHLVAQSYLSRANFLNLEEWPYFYENQTGMRGQFFQLGLLESVFCLVGLITVVVTFRKFEIVHVFLAIGVLSLFMASSAAGIMYHHVSFLRDLQFQWRFLSAFLFVPPVILAWLINQVPRPYFYSFIIIALLCWLRFPQLYGKDFLIHPESHYFFTPYNLQSQNLNTIWTGATESYPIEPQKYAVIGGSGQVSTANIHNSWRQYMIDAHTPLRMVDYTFYFPGWRAFVDGKAVPIEFQDMNYRGVITYRVPAGQHLVRVVFGDTKIRLLGKVLSVLGLILFFACALFGQRMMRIFSRTTATSSGNSALALK